ncbi:MAG: lipase maturation factor family protein [Alphaproteobacteria bacterium]|nr:lipase maturation factor family protein [Alphaproteobacteria bacterium]
MAQRKSGPSSSRAASRSAKGRTGRMVLTTEPPPVPGTERVRRLYLAGLGLTLAIAFASLWLQLPGLIGPQGILPLDGFLAVIDRALVGRGAIPGPDVPGLTAWLQRAWGHLVWMPTACWFLPVTWGPRLVAAVGVMASLFVAAGRYPAPALLVAWASYLSLSVVGQDFLQFQWDALAVETALASVLVAWWGARPRYAAWAPGWWVLRLLLFRLVFFGGLVKLTSHDPTWRDLTALTYHYATQPQPNPVSWYAHALPAWVQKLSAVGMFVVELGVVWGVLGPRRLRPWAALPVVGLMGLLALTGNYGFFQLLTVVLCVAVLDDRHLHRLNARLGPPPYRPPPPVPGRVAVGAAAAALVALAVAVSVPRYAQVPLPEAVEPVVDTVAPLRSVNTYGLFAVMTTTRPIPVLEARWGDGPWTELTWRWQTSDPMARPAQVAPLMPRLDWQLWFAGLSTCDRTPWTRGLMAGLLRGSEPIARLVGDLRLLTSAPPDAVRLVRYDYQFTAPGEGPAWWTRERVGLYCPEMMR